MIKIRMIQPLASVLGSYQPGQIIEVSEISPELEVLLTVPLGDGTFRAEIVRDDQSEIAVVGAPERAVRPKARGRVVS